MTNLEDIAASPLFLVGLAFGLVGLLQSTLSLSRVAGPLFAGYAFVAVAGIFLAVRANISPTDGPAASRSRSGGP